MRKYLLPVLALAMVVAEPLAAQDKENKEKDKEKSKMESNEEIIIKRKNDKDGKITIEIKGDEVTVNGKPIDDYDDDDIVVQKRKAKTTTIYSPFRAQGGALAIDGEPFQLNGDIPFLGVSTEKHEKGVRIEEVTENSSAEKGGLKSGDIITKIDEEKISSPGDLTKIIHKHKPDDKIAITYERDGKTNTASVKIGKRKNFDFIAPRVNVEEFKWDRDNFGPRAFTMPSKGRLGIKAQDTEDDKGVKVIDVDDESAAEKAGVKEDDIITEFDGKKVSSADELSRFAREAREKPSVNIKVNRNGKSHTLELKTPRKLKTANL